MMSGSSNKSSPQLAGMTGSGGVRVDLTRTPTFRTRFEAAVRVGLFAAAALSVLTTILTVFFLVQEAWLFLKQVPIADFLFGTKWVPLTGDPSFGVVPLVVDTVVITGIALLVAVPIGLLSAIYLSEFAGQRVKKVFKPILEVLAGVPTIVFGYFALTFFTPEVLRALLGADGVDQYNMLSAGVIVGLLIIPIVATVSEDAMAAVPQSLREGAFGVGADRRQVSTKIVFPAALSGIVAALVLAASRAFGETIVILLAGGSGTNILGVNPNPTVEGGSMAAFVAAPFGGDLPTESLQFKTVFMVAFLLFIITMCLNLLSIRLVRKYRQVYE